MKITCGIYLFNLDNKTLLVGHVTGFDKFSIPKGIMDPTDKGYWEAALREFLEETNIDFNSLNVLETHEFPFVSYKTQNKLLKSYLVIIRGFDDCKKIKCTSTFKNEKDEELPELDYFEWVSIKKAKKILSYAQIENLSTIKTITE